jgi:hypothetical protein
MASSSKKRTTMAKHNRENAVRERRLRKQAKKDARRLESTSHERLTSDAAWTAPTVTPTPPGT